MIILTSLRVNKPGSREVETFTTGHTVAAAVTVITAGTLARSVQICKYHGCAAVDTGSSHDGSEGAHPRCPCYS